MSLLWVLARSSRGRLLSALLTSVLAGAAASLLVGSINESLGKSAAELRQLGLEFAGLSLGMLFFRWLSQSQFVELSEATLARLRLSVSGHFVHAPHAELEQRGAGRLLSVLTEDVNTVADFFVTLPRFVMHGAVVLGCLGYLAWLSVPVFGCTLALLVLGVLGHLWSARRAQPHLWRGRESEDRVYGHFRALFAGAKELRQHARRRSAFLAQVLEPALQTVRNQQSTGFRIHAASASVRVFLFYVGIGAVIFLLGEALGLPQRVRSGYALMFLYMMLPLHALVEASPEISRTRVALDRIRALGLSQVVPSPTPAPPVPATAAPLAPFRSLQLRGVTYQYRREGDESVFELGPVDLELRPGESVFLVGGNGSGKTTLAKLLVGLYEPRAGQILFNGTPIGPDERELQRQSCSAVFSDFHLFPSLLGLPHAGLEQRARELLIVLELSHKVTLKDGVLSTTELSRGQQKRLALWVAWLEDRPLYVFDEWAADQDPAYKEIFYRRLLPELSARGKALLVITHDDRYFSLADRILRLESGRLEER